MFYQQRCMDQKYRYYRNNKNFTRTLNIEGKYGQNIVGYNKDEQRGNMVDKFAKIKWAGHLARNTYNQCIKRLMELPRDAERQQKRF